jgi:hypothetical protein
MGRPNFGQSQLTNRSGVIMRQSAVRQESGAVYVGKHDDLHGDGLFSIAKSIFKTGRKALKSAKKFAKSDLVKKGIKYGKKYGKQAIDLGSKAAELYGSDTGQAIKQALLPSDTPGFAGEKHAILDRGGGRGYVGANWLGPGTNVKKRLQRGDIGITPVDMLAMKHDVAYRKAQGAKSKADQLRMIRKADEDMVLGLKKIVALKADNPMNIKQAQLIIAKLGAEKAGLIAKGSFGGELETIPKDEMNLLNKAEAGLIQMGYGKKYHPASLLIKELVRRHKKGQGLKLAGQGKQSGGIFFTLATIIGGISAAASAAAAAAPAVTAVAGAVGATAGAALAVKELQGEGLKTVIAKKIKEEIKDTKVTTRDLPKNIIKVADKKLKTINNMKIPVKEKKELVVKQVAKPLIPLVKKKYVEKLTKNLKGKGLKLAGQGKGKGLNLAGQGSILTDKKILDTLKKQSNI